MFSTAWLSDRHPDRAAAACLLAIAMAHLAGETAATDADPRSWTALAARWGQGAVPGSAQATVDAALRHLADERGAAEAARGAGGDPVLAAGLVAAADAQKGPSDQPGPAAPAGLIEAARALVRAAAPRP
jgi:MFS family permease